MDITAQQTLLHALNGFARTHVLAAAIRLGLPEAMGAEAPVEQLGRDLGISPDRLSRLLRALVQLDICTEPRPGVYAPTEAGALLRADHPASLHAMAELIIGPLTQRPWTRLEHTIRTGSCGFEEEFGEPVFEYFAARPEATELYNTAMGESTRDVAAALLDAYDFDGIGQVADIGGGNGTLLAAILRGVPRLTGVLFDTVHGTAQAAGVLADVRDRCAIRHGDFFESVPTGADLYLLKNILHDWDDDRAEAILRGIAAALPAHGRLLLVEQVITGRDPFFADLTMLVLYGGRERTAADLALLCERAGLTLTSTLPLPTTLGFSVLEVRR
ncbi:methyltransferase [Pseudonocardiaceae bacterium YIM PH 21723]|nr:methyltransferase [Pseudonocardiaceae bacterium YIM PH 21723]